MFSDAMQFTPFIVNAAMQRIKLRASRYAAMTIDSPPDDALSTSTAAVLPLAACARVSAFQAAASVCCHLFGAPLSVECAEA